MSTCILVVVSVDLFCNLSPGAYRVSIKESSVAKLGSVCRRIYRIFSHAYFHHRQIFDEYEVSSFKSHLERRASWKKLQLWCNCVTCFLLILPEDLHPSEVLIVVDYSFVRTEMLLYVIYVISLLSYGVPHLDERSEFEVLYKQLKFILF